MTFNRPRRPGPDAYALRNSQGYWVGIWNRRDTAELARRKFGGHDELVEVNVVPVRTYRRRLMRKR